MNWHEAALGGLALAFLVGVVAEVAIHLYNWTQKRHKQRGHYYLAKESPVMAGLYGDGHPKAIYLSCPSTQRWAWYSAFDHAWHVFQALPGGDSLVASHLADAEMLRLLRTAPDLRQALPSLVEKLKATNGHCKERYRG